MIPLSEQAVIALTVALAHTALLGYFIVQKRAHTSHAALLPVYLVTAAGWNLLIAAQEQGFIALMMGGEWPLAPVYPVIVLALLLWQYTLLFVERDGPRWGGVAAAAVALGLVAAIDFSLLPLPHLVELVLSRPSLGLGLAAIVVTLFLGHAWRVAGKVQRAMYSPRHRNRIQFLQLSLLTMALGLGLYLSQAALAGSFGLLIHGFGGLILTYITLYRHLPNINSSVREFVGTALLILFTLTLFAGIFYALEIWLAGDPNARLKAALIGAALLAVVYFPFYRIIQRGLRKLLFRHQYNATQIIKTYIRTVNNLLLVEDLVLICLSFIEKNLQINRGAFFLLKSQDRAQYHFKVLSNLKNGLPDTLGLKKNSSLTRRLIDEGLSISQYTLDVSPEFIQSDPVGIQALKSMSFEQYIPIKRHDVLIAIWALGPFASGLPYTLQDIELLSTMADQTAIALENGRLFKNVGYNLEEITRIKELMGNIFSSIESGVITVDNENRITILNQAALTLLNLPPEVYVGNTIDRALNHLKHTPLPALLRDVKSTQRSYHAYEIVQEIPGRGVVNFSVDLTPIKDVQDTMQGVALVINDLTQDKRLQVVQNLFRKYLSPAVVDRLPDDPAQLKLGGRRQTVSILFADIRGFSTFSERQRPEDLINVLNKYLSMAAESILAYEGTLDKFMGDAVMAVFNAPLPQTDHALRAVKAAAAMQHAIVEFHQALGDYRPRLNFGVGIHTGEAVIGNVGTEARMDYTAVGDAVNLAKRIQENTPGGRILLSQSTYECVKNQVHAVFYKELTVKGRETPEKTYELLAIEQVLPPP